MFSPTSWLSEKSPANHSFMDESDASYVSNSQDPPTINSRLNSGLSTPSNPFNEFKKLQSNHLQVEESPNIKLAKFFASKGSAPLSEIELEGVNALLARTQSAQNSPGTPRLDSGHASSDEASSFNEDDEKLLKADTSKHSLNATPSFKATYNTSVSDADISNISHTSNSTSAFKKRVFDYSGVPSPYRTSRLKSSFSVNDIRGSSLKKEQKVEKEEEVPKVEQKKLSNTATALLSFLDSTEPDSTETPSEKDDATSKHKIVDFSNPYASQKKNKKSLNRSKDRKPTAIEKLEKTFNTIKQPAQEPQSFQHINEVSALNKYKPAKSSSLRESISLNDESDVSKDDIKDAATTTYESETVVESIVTDDEPAKPSISTSFSFGSKKDETTKNTSAFDFTVTEGKNPVPSSKESKPTTQTGFSFGSSTNKKEEESTKPKPLFAFGNSPTTKNSNASTSFTPAFSFNSSGTGKLSEEKKKDEDEQMDDDIANKSLTIRESQDVEIASNGTFKPQESAPVTKEPMFVFPSSERLGFTLKDVDETKLKYYQNVFKF